MASDHKPSAMEKMLASMLGKIDFESMFRQMVVASGMDFDEVRAFPEKAISYVQSMEKRLAAIETELAGLRAQLPPLPDSLHADGGRGAEPRLPNGAG